MKSFKYEATKYFLLFCVSLSCIFTMNAYAATTAIVDYTDYVDNVQYPTTRQTSVLTGFQNSQVLTIDTPTIIKVYINWDTTVVQNGTLWISKDVAGIDIIDTVTSLSNNLHYKTVFLDPGTYYINYLMGTATKDYTKSSTMVLGISVIGQKITTTEDNNVSSIINPNDINFSEKETGFLSLTSPVDYYKFILKEESDVNIDFNFNSYSGITTTNGKCALLDSSNQILLEKNYATLSGSNRLTKTLQPGIYYISMSGVTTDTSVKLTKTSRAIVTKVVKAGKRYKMSIKVPYDYFSIMVYAGKVTKANIQSYEYWNVNNIKCTDLAGGTTFRTAKKGTYTIRVYASDNTYAIKYVTVK